MLKTDGQCKIDSVMVGELTYTIIGRSTPEPNLAVKYGYANFKTNAMFGYANRNLGWSEKTMQLINELVASIEADIVAEVFEGGTTTDGGQLDPSDTTDGIESL